MAYAALITKIISDVVNTGTTIGAGVASGKQADRINQQGQINAMLQRGMYYKLQRREKLQQQGQIEKQNVLIEEARGRQTAQDKAAKVGAQKQEQAYNVANELQRINANPQMRQMVIQDLIRMRGGTR